MASAGDRTPGAPATDLATTPLPPVPAEGDFAGAREWMVAIRERPEVAPDHEEGLRERKKRLTRQEISDTATWMFCERGFDRVRVADIAAEVGVSEKTVFNYFPTKESLVFDREEDITAELVGALRDRDPSSSPVDAAVRMLAREQDRFRAVPREAIWMIQAFDELITTTPELVAAQRAMTKRMVAAVAEVLAASLELDPRDPEPQIVAHAIMGLWEVRGSSMSRHMEAGLAGTDLLDAIRADTARAARLLETGLWAFDLVAQGRRTTRQVTEAARAMDDARHQIADAMRQAREAWRAARGRDRHP